MAKKILSVGFEIPGGEIEKVDLSSNQSLLDADIIVFFPGIPHRYHDENYKGKPCLTDDSSFRSRQALNHWRRELVAAFEAGKLVFVFLSKPETVFAATGEVTYSGSGRNARAARHVEELSSYQAIPVKWRFHSAIGREMVVKPDARFFLPYWTEFGVYSQYNTYLEGDGLKDFLVKTKSGDRIVGACIRKGRGALMAVPTLELDTDTLLEERNVDGETDFYWTEDAVVLGKKFASNLVAVAEALASDASITPPPDWTRNENYRLSEENEIERGIQEVTDQIATLDDQRRELESKLRAAGTLRNLLFEQGKPLESAVLEALRLLGFDAKGLREDDSEFDAVFTSPEGRFIGEVEGKDNRAINIDKFSQLERNLNEDFARDEVDAYAKGVLFGNAFRLQPPDSRRDPFTEKCRTAAARLGVALVSTPDLFLACKYLKGNVDLDYARQCREAIFTASGVVVVFPAPPMNQIRRTEIQVEAAAKEGGLNSS